MPNGRKTRIKAFDLFCGGGGSSLGARQAGAIPVGGVDCWSLAADAYELNVPGAKAYPEKLCDVSPKKVLNELGPIDLLLASPECTHHSIAKGNKPRSEDSKQLAYEVVRFAKVLEPRWIVVENVVQMSTWHAFNDWLSQLHGLGYHSLVVKLNAADFEVPQTRRRLFVLLDRVQAPIAPEPSGRKVATVKTILRSALRADWSFKFTPLHNGRRALKTIERAERAIAEVGEEREFLMVYYGSDAAGGFQELDRPLRTITTLDRFALVRKNCVGHEMRMLQPSELAIGMGFPANYKFPDAATRRDCIKLMGNAVCPPLMRAVVRSLIAAD
ncbi:MAG: DNA cytosine methyltransferase [Planctomycetia bacterium]|nr:DNA cytosine methyltransferase [Planctomycetia bacterium]